MFNGYVFLDFSHSCPNTSFTCKNGRCVSRAFYCDFKNDCGDDSDEIRCDQCSSDSFQCYDGSCIPKSRVCDGQVDCKGNTREDEISGCSGRKFSSCSDYYKNGFTNRGVYAIHQSTNMAELKA
ncbi:complement factor I-like [Patella vulgata]|uniref:complement factor I-like n=1 Tax=Patella vulgata TaxID=6465 RepID=UPI0024A8C924|nr:complement factor I-like [Patella vulgata]